MENKTMSSIVTSQTNLIFLYVQHIPKIQKTKHSSVWQSYFCSTYYLRKDKFDKHVKVCSGQPGFIYNFNLQSLVTFEGNIKHIGDLPLKRIFISKLPLEQICVTIPKIEICLLPPM